jgi:hypothetical protein
VRETITKRVRGGKLGGGNGLYLGGNREFFFLLPPLLFLLFENRLFEMFVGDTLILSDFLTSIGLEMVIRSLSITKTYANSKKFREKYGPK